MRAWRSSVSWIWKIRNTLICFYLPRRRAQAELGAGLTPPNIISHAVGIMPTRQGAAHAQRTIAAWVDANV